MIITDALELLKEELLKRQKLNKEYSLRAFARDCGVSSGALSQIMNGKRNLTFSTAKRIASNIKFTLPQQKVFLKPFKKKNQVQVPYKVNDAGTQNLDIQLSIEKTIHSTILNLFKLDLSFKSIVQIAERIGESVEETQDAIERLKRLNLIEKRFGVYCRMNQRLRTSNDIPSKSLRKANLNRINLAKKALQDIEVNLRDITSMTIATDAARVDEMKNLITKFRREFLEFMEIGSKNTLYALNVQLFPLTRSEK